MERRRIIILLYLHKIYPNKRICNKKKNKNNTLPTCFTIHQEFLERQDKISKTFTNIEFIEKKNKILRTSTPSQ